MQLEQSRNAGINNWDFSILKDTRLNESLLVQFRAEFFNGWNHTQFGDANTGLVSGEFGRIGGLRIDHAAFAPRLLWHDLDLEPMTAWESSYQQAGKVSPF
jgi:hypothetical protein